MINKWIALMKQKCTTEQIFLKSLYIDSFNTNMKFWRDFLTQEQL